MFYHLFDVIKNKYYYDDLNSRSLSFVRSLMKHETDKIRVPSSFQY